ncbi:GIY-YIG nuclease family protein [Paraburkholderia phymatum]|uniref:GIY-YIG nuclease family protein n=1 Tax=Paraburkholderia phymatum TaxID=148447 RepID=A0ACC6UCE6_9BURK
MLRKSANQARTRSEMEALRHTTSNCEKLGFQPPEPVETLRSIAHLFGSSKSRCGIYLLAFRDHQFYIGQSVNVVSRFSQHRQEWDDLVGFSFLPVRQSQLNDVEERLIRDAEELGMVIRNRLHTSIVVGDTDLDLILAPEEQDAWLASPKQFNKRDPASLMELPSGQVEKFRHHYRRFLDQPQSANVIRLLTTYIHECLPAPQRTEYSFWSLSCMPSTNAATWPRLACINVGGMEVFVLGHYKDAPWKLWGFVNVATDALAEKYGNARELIAAFPGIRFSTARPYRDAGQFQIRLEADDQDFFQLMADSCVMRAAATLALRVMRKRPTFFGKHHCKLLSNAILNADTGAGSN